MAMRSFSATAAPRSWRQQVTSNRKMQRIEGQASTDRQRENPMKIVVIVDRARVFGLLKLWHCSPPAWITTGQGGDFSSDEERTSYEVCARAFTLLAQHADPSAAHFLAQHDLTLHD